MAVTRLACLESVPAFWEHAHKKNGRGRRRREGTLASGLHVSEKHPSILAITLSIYQRARNYKFFQTIHNGTTFKKWENTQTVPSSFLTLLPISLPSPRPSFRSAKMGKLLIRTGMLATHASTSHVTLKRKTQAQTPHNAFSRFLDTVVLPNLFVGCVFCKNNCSIKTEHLLATR